MTDDRRNDFGTKVKDGIVTGAIAVVLSLFINTTWITANEGKNKSIENTEKIIAQAGRIDALVEKIDTIRSDVKDIKNTLMRDK